MNIGGGTEELISPHKKTSIPEEQWETVLGGGVGILQTVFHRVDLRVSDPFTESLKDEAECRTQPHIQAGRLQTL